MTFLNPVVLIGLAAAAIPIILHLLNLRKLRTIEFSTLRFLKELQQTKIRRLKLRQIILLIIRTLIIIFIVLAFARPTIKGTLFGSIGSHARSTAVIILDNTFSMSVNDEHGERFKQAKDAALNITQLLEEDDEAFFIRLSELPVAVINPATHDIGLLRKIISESQISPIHRNLENALRLSAELLAQSVNANKEIYIISDRQQTAFPNPTGKNDSLPSFTTQTQLFFVPIGSTPVPNASIDSLSIISTIIENNKPVSVFVSVRNWSSNPLRNYVISAYLDGKNSAQSSIDIEPWTSHPLEIIVTPQKTGFVRGYLELEDDAVELDNRRYFTLSIPERTNIAILGRSDKDSRFIRSALEARSRRNGSLLTIQDITPDKFRFSDLNTVDVIISLNIPSFQESDCDRLKDFVERGNGLIIFPGPDIDINNYNRELLSKLQIPQVEIITGSVLQPANLSFSLYDFDHPLFETIFEKQRSGKTANIPGIESPSIQTALARKADKKSRTIITLNNGLPALTEHTLGYGKVLFFSIPASTEWSDFPIKGIFAPIMYRSVIYASPKEALNTSVITGDEITLHVPARIKGTTAAREINPAPYKLVAPDSVEEIISRSGTDTATGRPDRRIFLPIQSINQSGIYEIRKGTDHISLIASNTYPPESDPRLASDEGMFTFAERHGIASSNIHTTRTGETLQASILQTRYGLELWKYCTLIAIILALIEIIVARDRRSGAAES